MLVPAVRLLQFKCVRCLAFVRQLTSDRQTAMPDRRQNRQSKSHKSIGDHDEAGTDGPLRRGVVTPPPRGSSLCGGFQVSLWFML